jgi:hypothetical protein
MRTPQDVERGLTAPERLALDTRVEIRKAATQLLEEMPEGVGRLVIAVIRCWAAGVNRDSGMALSASWRPGRASFCGSAYCAAAPWPKAGGPCAVDA